MRRLIERGFHEGVVIKIGRWRRQTSKRCRARSVMRIPEGRYHIGTNGEGYPLCKCLHWWFVEACEISVAKIGYNVGVYFGQETPSSTLGTRKGQL